MIWSPLSQVCDVTNKRKIPTLKKFWKTTKTARKLVFSGCFLVLQRGFEPRTPCLKGRCSAYWATGAHQHMKLLKSENMFSLLKAWQGWLDSNQRMTESKSVALPLGYTPIKRWWKGDLKDPRYYLMGWVKGLEPSTPGTTIRCSNQLSYTHHILVRQEGFEPPTYCLEGSCSIQLSYWRMSIMQNPCAVIHSMERVMGIEPTYPAWKAGVLPLNYTRIGHFWHSAKRY